MPEIPRLPGRGWLALLGGGEFTFGETLEADEAWLARTPPGPVGFLPAASGSVDYGHHFTEYMDAEFARVVEVVPVYRTRDARRGKNLQRIRDCAAIYLGGGVADHLLDAVVDSPALEALAGKLRDGGVVVAIAAAAQAMGQMMRSLHGETVPALGWLPRGAVETNFDPSHDRRLRTLLGSPAVTWGLGLPAGSAVLLGPEGAVEIHGPVFRLAGPEADLEPMTGARDPGPDAGGDGDG